MRGSLPDVVSIGGANVGPFNDLITAELTPVCQLSFQYGLLSSMGAGTVLNSAIVDTNGGRLRLQSGTNSAGSAIYYSRLPARYRTGQGVFVRFTPIWDGATASNNQFWGVGTVEDELGFEFNGTTFGIKMQSFTSTITRVAQTAWNVDTCDGNGPSGFNYDKTKGTPVGVLYPYLGYGPRKWYIMHPTGYWILCHVDQYPNTTATIQLQNPSMYFKGSNVNSGSTTNRTMYCGSVGIFSVGQTAFPNPTQGAWKSAKAVTTETCLMNIKNCTTFNGVANRSLIRLRSVSLTYALVQAAQSASFHFKYGVTIGGTPSYTCYNGTTANNGDTITSGQSLVSVDVAGTTVTGGLARQGFTMAAGGNQVFDLSQYNIFIIPGEVLTVSSDATSAGNNIAYVNWDEEI